MWLWSHSGLQLGSGWFWNFLSSHGILKLLWHVVVWVQKELFPGSGCSLWTMCEAVSVLSCRLKAGRMSGAGGLVRDGRGDYSLLTFSLLLLLWWLTGLTKAPAPSHSAPRLLTLLPWPDRHSWPTGGPPHGYLYTAALPPKPKSGNPTANKVGEARDFSQPLCNARRCGNSTGQKVLWDGPIENVFVLNVQYNVCFTDVFSILRVTTFNLVKTALWVFSHVDAASFRNFSSGWIISDFTQWHISEWFALKMIFSLFASVLNFNIFDRLWFRFFFIYKTYF